MQPEELKSKIDVELRNEPTPNDELEKLMEQAIDYSVKTGEHPFLNQTDRAITWAAIRELAIMLPTTNRVQGQILACVSDVMTRSLYHSMISQYSMLYV